MCRPINIDHKHLGSVSQLLKTISNVGQVLFLEQDTSQITSVIRQWFNTQCRLHVRNTSRADARWLVYICRRRAKETALVLTVCRVCPTQEQSDVGGKCRGPSGMTPVQMTAVKCQPFSVNSSRLTWDSWLECSHLVDDVKPLVMDIQK